MRYLIPVIILVVSLGGICYGCSSDGETTSAVTAPTVTKPAAYQDVSPVDAMDLINTVSNLVIVDVSPVYANGHIPVAENYVMADGTLTKVLPKLNQNLPYLVYCHSDSVSMAASQLMIDSGFRKVFRLSGNYAAWLAAGYKVDTGEPSRLMTVWWPDGVVDEYDKTIEISDSYKLYWDIDDHNIYMAVQARTDGWISVGFEPTSRMKDADMIFGYIAAGKTVIVDMFSTGPLGPHPVDTELGGTDDIRAFGGTENNDYTVIEFKRRLVTDDSYDHEFTAGEIHIIWAYGSGDSLSQRHSNRGSAEINLE